MLHANEHRPKMVLVTWLDSKVASDGWEYLDGMEPVSPMRVDSVGWLVEDVAAHITIAGDVSDTQVLGRRTIPRSAIVEPVLRLTPIHRSNEP